MRNTPSVRLRTAAFLERAQDRGLGTDGAIAAHIGVDRSTVQRVRVGDIDPGERFIAGTIASGFGTFDELFEAVTEPSQDTPEAVG